MTTPPVHACPTCNCEVDDGYAPGSLVLASDGTIWRKSAGCSHSTTPEGQPMNRNLGFAAALAYVGVVVLANILSSRYGMVGVGFGLVASAGTYAAGFALGLKDAVREGLGRWGVVGVILVGSALSFLLADPLIATASLAAFSVSEILDSLVYEPLRTRSKLGGVVTSNTVGAVMDTYIFLSLAPFGPVTFTAMQGQLVGKILWATLVPVALIAVVRRARESRA